MNFMLFSEHDVFFFSMSLPTFVINWHNCIQSRHCNVFCWLLLLYSWMSAIQYMEFGMKFLANHKIFLFIIHCVDSSIKYLMHLFHAFQYLNLQIDYNTFYLDRRLNWTWTTKIHIPFLNVMCPCMTHEKLIL